jgi:NAD-dependent deacetylase
MNDGVERAAQLLARAHRGVAFTGAGVSAESGIRTFRGENGLWKQYDPVKVASLDHFMLDPAAYWSVSKERYETYRKARPNRAHIALAAMEEAGIVQAVVTQNTDGLHREAGSREVVELHGSGRTVACLDCGSREPREVVQARLDTEMPPHCTTCGSIHIKPEVIFFGEAMPVAAMERAFQLASECDLMLVAGSSLVVFPAAGVPVAAVEAGAPLVIVNAEQTPLDELAAVVLRGSAGEILPHLLELSGR